MAHLPSSPDELKDFLAATVSHLNATRKSSGLPEVSAVLHVTIDAGYWPIIFVESQSREVRERPVQLFRYDDFHTAEMNYQADKAKFQRRGEFVARVEGNDKTLKQVGTPERFAGALHGLMTRKNAPSSTEPAAPARQKVLIVHGQNLTVRDRIDLYLTKELRLETVVMQEGANKGRTLAEKFEQMAAECGFAVFIFTADDHLLYKESRNEVKRARQNVILEAGFMWGAIGRHGKAAFLVEPGIELPSDIDGVGWIPITADLGETKMRLRKELVASGLLTH